jgi:branched-chain amino acid transport system substrate-binding protein
MESPVLRGRRRRHLRKIIPTLFAGLLAVAGSAGAAEKKYGPGVTDTEIKIGQTVPFSGPASSFAIVARIEAAYLQMINSKGGVNGRKIELIQLDDAYSPPRAVEQTRKLVDSDEVLAIAGTVGTPSNLAVAKYLNSAKAPQIVAMRPNHVNARSNHIPGASAVEI